MSKARLFLASEQMRPPPAANREPGPADSGTLPEPGPRSVWAIRALLVYIVLLPVHSLLITILLAHGGVPLPVLKVLAAWKEVLLLATVLGLAGTAAIHRKLPPPVWVDWIALAWLSQVLLYLGLRDLFPSRSLGLAASLFGMRDWILYVFPYFIGRLMVVRDRDVTMALRTLLVMGVVTSLAGILEYLLVPTRWHLELGIPRYFAEFLNLHYPATWGLPINYWQGVGNQVVRRAVSVYLSGQAFALPFLLFWPLALLNLHTRWTRVRTPLVLLSAAALFLTLTRMTIAVCFLQGVMLLWLVGRRYLLAPYLAGAVVATALFLGGWVPLRVENPAVSKLETSSKLEEASTAVTFGHTSPRSMATDTVTLSDSSSRVRPEQWAQGWAVLREHPAGLGLGSTGITAGRYGAGGMGNEAGFLKVGGALGFPGLLIFLGWFLGIILLSSALSRSADDPWRGLAVLTLITAIGWLINSLTVPPDQSLLLAYVFPWLAGMIVRRWTQLRTPATA